MTLNDKESSGKVPKFECKFCNYVTIRESQYTRHLLTRKHKMMTNDDAKVPKSSANHVCSCGKSYKYRQGLFQHKKKCSYIDENENMCQPVHQENSSKSIISPTKQQIQNKSNLMISETSGENDYKEMFIEMVHQNKELQKTLIKQQEQINEMIPKIGNTTNSHNTQNNHFNLQLFLNEQCKDAVNLIDFVKSLHIELSQLEYIGKNGFAEGMTNIFTKAIENMEVTKRPIHCTDLKRETLYIKDNEQWNKDNDQDKMKTAIDVLKQNNIAKISDWVKENPECDSYEHPKSDLLINIIQNHAKEDRKSLKKIIKNIAKSSVIPKSFIDNDNQKDV